MRTNQQRIKYSWLLLLVLPAALSCGGKKSQLAKLMAGTENGLLQEKKAGNKTILVQVLPPHEPVQNNGSSATSFYRVKLVLRTNEKVKGSAAMQYMNFGIKNSFYAVQGTDTLPCVICERIPGVNDKEYLYMTVFNKPLIKDETDAGLRVFVSDSIAGFGTAVFEIKREALNKLEAIK